LESLPAAVAEALPSLDSERECIVYRHHGVRSAAAVELLRADGVRRAPNVEGAIARWSAEVDPSVPRY
jgi:rhodanese-related sulfurtransferase